MKTILLAVIVIGGVMVFWLGVRVALGTEYPLLTVASGSMVPTLYRGDLIVVQGISNFSEVKAGPWKSPTEGDVIIFRRPAPYNDGELIVHRAVSKSKDADGLWYFKTQGDANTYGPDPWKIPESLVVGRVIAKVPWLGYVPLLMRETPYGILLIIVLILIIIFTEFIPVLSKKQPTAEG